jgi:GNAT superfamily N-acetyltransferase
MIFGSTDLAKRIEFAQAQSQLFTAEAHQRLYPDSLHATKRVGNGVAYFAGVDSPMTQVFGLGLEGGVATQEIAELEEFFLSRHSAVTIEVANVAALSFTEQLAGRGYTVAEYSHVLGFDCSTVVSAPRSLLQPYAVQTLEMDDVADSVAAGFMEHNVGEKEIPADFRDIFLTFLRAEGSRGFAVSIDGEIAGAGTMFIENGVATLGGASTQPKFRNRGVQKALIIERLKFAREAGCDIAVVVTAPGTISQYNMLQMGFQILYARTKFTLPCPELSIR